MWERKRKVSQIEKTQSGTRMGRKMNRPEVCVYVSCMGRNRMIRGLNRRRRKRRLRINRCRGGGGVARKEEVPEDVEE